MRAVVNRSLEEKRPQHEFALSALARSIDTKVEAGKRLPLPRTPFKHHFRWVQIFAPFLLVGDTVSMVTPGTPFSKSFRLQALPSPMHSCLAFLCRMSSDIGLASLGGKSNARHTVSPIKSP